MRRCLLQRRLVVAGRGLLDRQAVARCQPRRRREGIGALARKRALGRQPQQTLEAFALARGERRGYWRPPSLIPCIVQRPSLTNGQFAHQGASSAILCD